MRHQKQQHAQHRDHAHAFGERHQRAARAAVSPYAERNRQQQERQCLRGLQQTGLACAGAEREHGDERRGGEADLLGGLRDQIRPREPLECGRQTDRG